MVYKIKLDRGERIVANGLKGRKREREREVLSDKH